MKITKGGIISGLLAETHIPKMFRAAQEFPRPVIKPDEIRGVVFDELSRREITCRIKPGMSIAITAGSRGIRNVGLITRAIADFVKEKRAHPFIVPAMGSHGGANAQGQLEVLEGYGITESLMGCPVKSSMEVAELGYSELGRRVVIDRHAVESDGIIVSCRIKPHNAFRGTYESGPCKMLAVGLGKRTGAEQVHSDGMGMMGENIPTMAKVVIDKAPVLFAVPCVENAYDETCLIEAIPAEDILRREPELLKYAFANMPNLLVKECDVLAVHEIGKNYSGTGVDPNITGTFSTKYASGGIKAQRSCFLNLSPESHGNALGIGLANVVTEKIFNAIDTEKMYANCITSTVLASAVLPCVVATDREALQLCIRTCTGIDKNNIRVVYIANSLNIGSIMLSEAYYGDAADGKYPGLKVLDDPRELRFDKDDNIMTDIRLS